MDYAQLVSALFGAAKSQRGGWLKRPGPALKAAASAFGTSVPVGDGDGKTASPGTYRPVGGTCPSTCPFLGNGCYAEGGNVAMHQRRAAAERNAALIGAAVAFVWARVTERVARLHVSGDVGQTWDREYLRGLRDLAIEVNTQSGALRGTPVAWSYTHHKMDRARLAALRTLASVGVHVRRSDHLGHNGVVVMPFAEVPAVRRETGVRLAKCPAQLRSTNCADCTLCWTRPDLTVVFDPHGQANKKATTAGRAAIGLA